MDLSTTLIKQIIVRADTRIWSLLRRNYLPSEYHDIYRVINSFYDRFRKLPTFAELNLDLRDRKLREQLMAIEIAEVEDIDPELLLEFLKNDYAQKLAFEEIKKLIDNSRGFETADDTLDTLQGIVTTIRDKIDLEDEDANLQTLNPFESDEEIENRFVLGLNANFDSSYSFKGDDYIMLGGYRGQGKSVICSNICSHAAENGESYVYFSVEMKVREILQRNMAISTGVDAKRLKNRNLSVKEWETVSKWWADRYEGGEEVYQKYLSHREFDLLHEELARLPLTKTRGHIVYDPQLTIGRINAELDLIVEEIKPRVIIVDYVNEILLNKMEQSEQYKWENQIKISRSLKNVAQKYNIPVIAPYQTDKDGNIKISKGISNPADYMFKFKQVGSDAMLFETDKSRGDREATFCSKVNWSNLRIGPEDAEIPDEDGETESDEEPSDIDEKPF